jgi:hypothetical protein
MRATPESASSYLNQPSLGNRATSFLIALAFVALLMWMLIRMGLLPDTLSQPPQNPLSLIDMRGDHPSQGAKKALKISQPHRQPAAAARPAAAIPPPKVPPPPIPWNVIPMSHDEFASSDIASKPSRAQASGQGEQGADSGAGGGADNGDGGGSPKGDQLYNAQWYPRPPSQSEMDFYLSKTAHVEGWGEIACRTAARYAVVDCKELGDTPGSGFARAMVNASWQFHVLPPRVNGRPMVGSWVRIHYDFYIKDSGGSTAP